MPDDRQHIERAARQWVARYFPHVTGTDKSRLILAYGCGMEAGLAETEEGISDAG